VVNLALRDTVVVGSDGLFDNLYLGEIIELVRKSTGSGRPAVVAGNPRTHDVCGRQPAT
jgi:hypothetical protein